MLNMELEPQQERLVTKLKELAQDTIRPRTYDIEAARRVPEDVIAQLTEFGLPGDDGFSSGANDPVSFCLAAEALGWGNTSVAYSWLASRQVAWLIAAAGTDEQKRRWLPKFGKNPMLPASLYLHEGRGSPPSELNTSVEVGAGEAVFNGTKSPVFFPADAEVSVVIGRDENGRLRGAIVEDRGSSITFNGLQEERIALRACPVATSAKIENLVVPGDNLLDETKLSRAISVCRLAHAALSLGVASATTRYAGDWAQKRIAFGQPIINFQGVSFVLVDLVMAADAARLSIEDLITSKLDDEELELQTTHVIAEANRVLQDASREGVQTLGVHGITTEHPASAWYRDAAVLASIDFDPLATRIAYT